MHRYTQLITKPRADGHVRCILHVAPIGAPRPDEAQLNAQATMQRFYARKYLRQLAAFGADGFALCKACVDGAPGRSRNGPSWPRHQHATSGHRGLLGLRPSAGSGRPLEPEPHQSAPALRCCVEPNRRRV